MRVRSQKSTSAAAELMEFAKGGSASVTAGLPWPLPWRGTKAQETTHICGDCRRPATPVAITATLHWSVLTPRSLPFGGRPGELGGRLGSPPPRELDNLAKGPRSSGGRRPRGGAGQCHHACRRRARGAHHARG
jgi:hypothetical protein